MGWSGSEGWAGSAVRGLGAVQEAEEAAEQIEWVQQVRDLGPLVWLVALAATAAWLLVIALAAAKVRPRRVAAGPDLLDPPGDEPPALVNLVTNSWNLGHESVSATLLDLATRGHVSIHSRGDGSVSVHVPAEGRADEDQLAPYERQVLVRVRQLASATPSRVVPAGALTTGTGREARTWWSHFRGSVLRDATDRGLARKRWSKALYLLLFLTGAPVAVPWGVALATAVYEDGTDGELSYGAVVYSILGLFVPLIVIGVIAGKRRVADTEAGRHLAARWLGLRAGLGANPMFTESDAAGISVWGRKLAYGAALGIAHGAVTSVPLGAEDRRELWSTASGSWRLVRVRYSWPGTFSGRHPAWAIAGGLLLMGALIMPYQLFQLGVYDDLGLMGVLPLVPFLVPGLWGAFGVLRGLGDLLAGRRTVVGEVLRVKETWTGTGTGTNRNPSWHVVVDDGVSDQVDAWRVHRRPRTGEGARVQGEVSRWLRHLRNTQILAHPDGSTPGPDDDSRFLGDYGVSSSRSLQSKFSQDGGLHMDVRMALQQHSSAPGHGTLPDAAALARATGREVRVDRAFIDDPLVTSSDRAVGFHLGTGTVQIVRLMPDAFHVYSRLKFLHAEVEGVGEEAIRLKASGTLLVRQGPDVVMVAIDAPDDAKEVTEQLQLAVAHAALATVAPSDVSAG